MTRTLPLRRGPAAALTTALTFALAGGTGPARADDEQTVDELVTPESSVSAGVAGVSGNNRDRARFGLYNGLRKESAYALVDIDLVKRDNATGTWTTLEGRNLGLDSRELRFGQYRQGDWKYALEYNELVRRNPYTINTGLAGAGTTTPVVNLLATPGSGTDLDTKIKREALGLTVSKWFGKDLQFELSLRSEDRDGSRLYGRGFTCPSGAAPSPVCTTLAAGVNQWAILMLPEPINSTTRQIEARLNYANEQLAVSAGYYGSFYANANGTLTPTVPGTLNNALGTPVALQPGLQAILQLPVALPPDNQAHQVYVQGTYGFNATTRATFKLGYTHATQHDDFAGKGLTGAPAGITSYGGVVDTTLAQVGLTARPLPKLSVLANLRYEDRHDKSPLALYNIEGANRFINGTYSLKKTAAKLEASYPLDAGFRVIAGIDYEQMDRGQYSSPECVDLGDGSCLGDSIAGLSGLRAKTDETSYRFELRRSLTDAVNGALAFVHSERNGSSWLKPQSLPATGVIEADPSPTCVPPPAPAANNCIYNRTGIFPMIFMDRTRNKGKLALDWAATEQLSVQLVLEEGRDTYSAPTTKGLQSTRANLASLDIGWSLSDAWTINGYASQSKQVIHVAQGNLGYIAALDNTDLTVGLGVQGKFGGKIVVGADLSYTDDRNGYGLTVDSGVPPLSAGNLTTLANNTAQAAIGLPGVRYRIAAMKLFGTYSLQKNSSVRVDLIHQESLLREFAWGVGATPFAYSDGTTVSQQARQNVTLVAVRYIYRWQ